MGPEETDPQAGPTPLATIMVVDDESSIRSLPSRFLAKSGYMVLESANGRDALEKLQRSKVDVLISDIVMPERDGLKILQALRRDFAALKVIVMSGGFDGQFLRTAEMLDAHATLQKPLKLNLVLGDGARDAGSRLKFEVQVRTYPYFALRVFLPFLCEFFQAEQDLRSGIVRHGATGRQNKSSLLHCEGRSLQIASEILSVLAGDSFFVQATHQRSSELSPSLSQSDTRSLD